MSQLKRKSIDTSPGLNEDAHNDVPNKRFKAEDATGASLESEDSEEHRDSSGDNSGGNSDRKQGEATMEDDTLKEESLSPVVRRRISSSPNTQRRAHGRKVEDSYSPPRRPERRDSETSKRESHGILEKDRNSRNSFSQEDKKRGKRLFGGLLSTLSQTTTNSQQKKRQEIEKRQQERATKQRIEDNKRRSEKLVKLERIRNIEQIRFDEQVMRTRHSNMLSMAHSLQTRSEPKLCYRPWELTPEQENSIRDQIRDTEAQIKNEVQNFKRQKEQRLKDLGAVPPSSEVDGTVSELVEDHSNNAAKDEFTTAAASATNDRKSSPAPAPEPRNNSHEDKDHDEIVEAEEDTVIY